MDEPVFLVMIELSGQETYLDAAASVPFFPDASVHFNNWDSYEAEGIN